MPAVDDNFYARADEHIKLSNDQLGYASAGKVSASMMFSTARFNAWVSAQGFSDAEAMKLSKEATVTYFMEQYEAMLRENLDDYIHNFTTYVTVK